MLNRPPNVPWSPLWPQRAHIRGQHPRGADELAPLAFDKPYPYCPTKACRNRRCATRTARLMRRRSDGAAMIDVSSFCREDRKKGP